ncbi:hypothetical protein OQA88_12173 [Cercophora sp. LCS_1]
MLPHGGIGPPGHSEDKALAVLLSAHKQFYDRWIEARSGQDLFSEITSNNSAIKAHPNGISLMIKGTHKGVNDDSTLPPHFDSAELPLIPMSAPPDPRPQDQVSIVDSGISVCHSLEQHDATSGAPDGAPVDDVEIDRNRLQSLCENLAVLERMAVAVHRDISSLLCQREELRRDFARIHPEPFNATANFGGKSIDDDGEWHTHHRSPVIQFHTERYIHRRLRRPSIVAAKIGTVRNSRLSTATEVHPGDSATPRTKGFEKAELGTTDLVLDFGSSPLASPALQSRGDSTDVESESGYSTEDSDNSVLAKEVEILSKTLQVVYGLKVGEANIPTQHWQPPLLAFLESLDPHVRSIGDAEGTGGTQSGFSAGDLTTGYGQPLSSVDTSNKRRSDGSEGLDNDAEGGTRGAVAKRRKVAGERPIRYGCPFRLKAPGRFGVRERYSCSMTYFESVSKVKEHVRTNHICGPRDGLACQRCKEIFPTQVDLDRHIEPTTCIFKELDPLDGISEEQLRNQLTSRKAPQGESELDQWKRTWKVLFPLDQEGDIKPPDYHVVMESFELRDMYLDSLPHCVSDDPHLLEKIRNHFLGVNATIETEAKEMEYFNDQSRRRERNLKEKVERRLQSKAARARRNNRGIPPTPSESGSLVSSVRNPATTASSSRVWTPLQPRPAAESGGYLNPFNSPLPADIQPSRNERERPLGCALPNDAGSSTSEQTFDNVPLNNATGSTDDHALDYTLFGLDDLPEGYFQVDISCPLGSDPTFDGASTFSPASTAGDGGRGAERSGG